MYPANFNPIRGIGNPKADIMFIAETPSNDAKAVNEIFSGRSSQFLFEILSELFSIPVEDIKSKHSPFYFTNIVKCYIPNKYDVEDKKLKDIAVSCSDYAKQEIEEVDPKIVVLLGRAALNGILGGATKVESKRGRIHTQEINEKEYKFVPVFHQSYVFRNPNVLQMFIKDLELMKRYVDGDLEKEELDYTMVDNKKSFNKMITFLERKQPDQSSWDVETSSFDFASGKAVMLLGMSFYNSELDEEYNFMLDIKRFKFRKGLTADRIIPVLLDSMGGYCKYLIGQNFKYDMKHLFNYGFPKRGLKSKILDTMIMSYVLNEERFGRYGKHSLENLLGFYFPEALEYKVSKGEEAKEDRKKRNKELSKEEKKQKQKESKVDVDKGNPFDDPDYCMNDAIYTGRIARIFLKEFEEKKNKKLRRLYFKLYEPALKLMTRVEYRGAKINVNYLLELDEKMSAERDDYEKKLRGYLYRIFDDKKYAKGINFNSSPQKKVLCFEKLKLPIVHYTKSKKKGGGKKKKSPSTGKDAFEKWGILLNKGELFQCCDRKYTKDQRKYTAKFIKLYNKYSRVKHLHKNFVIGIQVLLDKNNRIHGTFKLVGTVTGRLSSARPNLQNIPRTTTNSEIKKLFIPSHKKWYIVEVDYSQAELRVLAHFSQSKTLIEAFTQGFDIHLFVASEMYGVPFKEAEKIYYNKDLEGTDLHIKWKKWRKRAKTIVFGIVYGVGPDTLAENLSDPDVGEIVSREEAIEFIEMFYRKFPEIRDYIERCIKFVRRHKYIDNVLGRRRHLPNINSEAKNLAAESERKAVNSPIQATASDFALFSAVLIDKYIHRYKLRAHEFTTVHDSILYDVHLDDILKLHKIVDHVMPNPPLKKYFKSEFTVPLDYGIEVGPVWGEMYGDLKKFVAKEKQKYKEIA